MSRFMDSYFEDFSKVMRSFLKDADNRNMLDKAVNILKSTKASESVIYLVGNGGSSAIAEHMAIDLTKNAGLKAMAVSGSPMLTTFSNDYGYERVFEKALEHFAKKGDVLIAISSSGSSKNILNACKKAREKKMHILTFSGFDKGNPLRRMGGINLWVNSRAFGYVELMHNLLIHYINDAVIGSVEYMIR